MRGLRENRRDDQGGLAVLAMFALFLQLTIPQGFMVSATGGGPAMVICTGHGPVTATSDHALPGKAPSGKAGAVCAFAGHGGTPTTAPLLALTHARYEQVAANLSPRLTPSPGRGLAAPPPPSHAPPSVSI